MQANVNINIISITLFSLYLIYPYNIVTNEPTKKKLFPYEIKKPATSTK